MNNNLNIINNDIQNMNTTIQDISTTIHSESGNISTGHLKADTLEIISGLVSDVSSNDNSIINYKFLNDTKPGEKTNNGEIFSSYTSNRNIADNTGTHAEGGITQALGMFSHSEGVGSVSKGICSHAEGSHTNASGLCSHAEGFYTAAFNTGMSSVGRCNVIDTDENKLFVVGNGIDEDSRNDAFIVNRDGSVYIQNSLTINNQQIGNSNSFKNNNSNQIISICDDNQYIYILYYNVIQNNILKCEVSELLIKKINKSQVIFSMGVTKS